MTNPESVGEKIEATLNEQRRLSQAQEIHQFDERIRQSEEQKQKLEIRSRLSADLRNTAVAVANKYTEQGIEPTTYVTLGVEYNSFIKRLVTGQASVRNEVPGWTIYRHEYSRNVMEWDRDLGNHTRRRSVKDEIILTIDGNLYTERWLEGKGKEYFRKCNDDDLIPMAEISLADASIETQILQKWEDRFLAPIKYDTLG